jgi:phthalate 4,5-cis-dihydrodiol dehydrogenase
MIKIGVVGFGRHFRRSLLPNLIFLPDVQLVAIAELDGELRREAGERFPGVTLFEDGRALYDSGIADAVIIAARPQEQFELAESAIDHGLHVFVEKPVGTDSSQVATLAEAAAKKNVVAMAGTMWRYTAASRVLTHVLEERQTEISMINLCASFPSFAFHHDWDLEPMTIAFYSMFIHPVDWVTALLGEAKEVHAEVSEFLPDDGVLHVQVLMRTASGTATLSLATGTDCECRKPMPPGDIHESRLRRGRAAGRGSGPGR